MAAWGVFQAAVAVAGMGGLTSLGPWASMMEIASALYLRRNQALMLIAFVESIKYVGHLLPISFLRVFIGYSYFNQALVAARGDFLAHAYLAEEIRAFLPGSPAPEWFKMALDSLVIPHWQVFAVGLIAVQFAIGVSYILGYLVRPFALLGIVLGVCLLWALGPQPNEIESTFMMVLHFTLGWIGAGRCLGMDYYFYKRHRGIWW